MQPGMTGTDPFNSASASGPVMRCLGHDRLVCFVPLRVEQQQIPTQYLNGRPAGTVQDVLVADLIVCDGAPIYYGGEPGKGVPDTEGPLNIPAIVPEFRVYQAELIGKLRGWIGRGPVLNRLLMGKNKQNLDMWKLGDLRDGDRQIAMHGWNVYQSGQFQTAPAAPAQPVPPAAPTYPVAPVQAAPVQSAPPAPAYPQAPAQPVSAPVPSYSPPAVQPGVPAPVYPQAPAQYPVAAPQPPVPPAPPVPAAPAAHWTDNRPPAPGYPAEQWASFSPPQREQIYAMNGINPQNVDAWAAQFAPAA